MANKSTTADFLQIPGWRVEKFYSPGVRIGNWSEEERNFTKGSYQHNSTNRLDFHHYGRRQPDVVVRRRGELRNHGLPKELFFHHHGNMYTKDMVTWYDEDYNGRWREKNLPATRKWDRHSLSWVPEKSDVHVQAPPTNYGLLSKLQLEWAAQLADQEKGDYLSTYALSYQPSSPEHRVRTRYAVPAAESSKLHPVNNTCSNLLLRNTRLLKCPEMMPAVMTSVSV